MWNKVIEMTLPREFTLAEKIYILTRRGYKVTMSPDRGYYTTKDRKRITIDEAIVQLLKEELGSISVSATIGGGGSITSAEFLSLVNRVSTNSALVAGGSVTSNELSALSAAMSSRASVLSQAISVVSNTLSVETANRVSADNALSVALDTAISNEASARGAADTNLESLISVVDDLISNEISNRTSASAILDAKISTLSAKVVSLASSLTSVDSHAATASAAATSVDGRLNSVRGDLSNWISAVSVVAAGGGGSITSIEYASLVDRVSANSVVGVGGSVTSNELSAVEARVNTLSNGLSNEISNRLSHVNVVSNAISVETASRTSADNALSGAISVVSNALSATAAYWTDALSSHISAASVAIATVSNAVSNEISNRASADNALSNIISALSTTLSPQYFYPTEISVNVGTLVSGTTANLSAYGGDSLLLSEIASTPGYLMTLQFSAVAAIPNVLIMYGRYEGNPAHIVNVDIFNHTTSVWDTLGVIPSAASAANHEYNILGGSNYVSTNNARVRINHVTAGTTSHSQTLDYVTLAKMLQGVGITDHGALQGLLNDDHIQYALADGTRGFSALSDLVSALSARVTSGLTSLEALRSTLSARVVSLASSLTSVDTHANDASAAATSIDSRLTSVRTDLSNWISAVSVLAVGGGGSVTSNELSDALSLLGALSNKVSNESSNWHSADANLANAISTVSAQLVSVSAVLESHAATASAAATSVDARLNSVISTTISDLISAKGGGGGSVTSTELSNATSVWYALLLSVADALSADISYQSLRATSLWEADGSLSARVNSIETRLSNLSANHVSLASSLLSVDSHVSLASLACDSHADNASAAATSVNNRLNSVLSTTISAMQATIATSATFNNRLSALSVAWTFTGQVSVDKFSMVVLSAAATVSASALTGVSGTTIQLSANSFYIVKGMFAVNMPNAVSLKKYGLTFPAMNTCRGVMRATYSAAAGIAGGSVVGQQPFNEDSSNSAIFALNSVGLSASLNFVEFEGIMYPSDTGNLYFMVGAQAGAGAAVIKIGSFIRTEKYR